MAEFNLNEKIEKLKKLKELIDAEIQKIQTLQEKQESDLSVFEGVEGADVLKKEAIERAQLEMNAAKKPLEAYLKLIDLHIINDANVRAEMVKNGSVELDNAIRALTEKALLESVSKVGITVESKTAKTMEQLDRTENDKLEGFNERYAAALKVAKEAEQYENLQKVLAGKKDPKVELERIKKEAEAKVAEIDELDSVDGYKFADEIKKLQESVKANGAKPKQIKKNYGKKENKDKVAEILKKLEALEGTESDKEIQIKGGKKVKLSQLSKETIDPQDYDAVLSAVLSNVSDQEKINQDLKGKRTTKKSELDKLINENGVYLGLVEIDGKNALTVIKELLAKEDMTTKDFLKLLEKAVSKENLNKLEELAKADPEKYKGAKEELAKLQALKDKGYDGTEVGKYSKKGLSLDFLSKKLRGTKAAEDIDFAEFPKYGTEDFEIKVTEVSKSVFEEIYTNADDKAKLNLRKRVDADKSIDTTNKPRNFLPGFVANFLRKMGYKTRQDRWYEEQIKAKIAKGVRHQADPDKDRAERAEHAEVEKAWQLDAKQAEAFRIAERRIIIEHNATSDKSLTDAEVRAQAAAEARKIDDEEPEV